MAIPRPALLAIAGGVLIVAAFVVMQALHKDDGGESSAPAAPAAQQTAPKSAPAARANRAAHRARAPAKAKTAAPTPSPRAQAPTGASPTSARLAGTPTVVTKALADHRVVVLFFTQGGADDRATAKSVSSIEGVHGAKVVKDSIDNVSRYRRITAGLGVDQAPSIVIVSPSLQARLLEGYIDSDSLRQFVTDTVERQSHG